MSPELLAIIVVGLSNVAGSAFLRGLHRAVADLRERMAERACGDTWRNIRDDLKQIQLVQLSGPNGRLWQVTEPREGARKRLKALRIKAPPTLLELAWAPGDVGMRTHLRKGLICLAKSGPCIYEVSKSGRSSNGPACGTCTRFAGVSAHRAPATR